MPTELGADAAGYPSELNFGRTVLQVSERSLTYSSRLEFVPKALAGVNVVDRRCLRIVECTNCALRACPYREQV